jgi:hypothetical protein
VTIFLPNTGARLLAGFQQRELDLGLLYGKVTHVTLAVFLVGRVLSFVDVVNRRIVGPEDSSRILEPRDANSYLTHADIFALQNRRRNILGRHLIQLRSPPNTVRVIHQQSTTTQRYSKRRMEYARLETATLKDITDAYYYGCSCQSCLHTARLSLSTLRSHLGADFPLREIRGRLKCQICSSRKVTITFLGPHQMSGNLHNLSQKEPR